MLLVQFVFACYVCAGIVGLLLLRVFWGIVWLAVIFWVYVDCRLLIVWFEWFLLALKDW